VYNEDHETFDNNSEVYQDNNGPAVKRIKGNFQEGDLRLKLSNRFRRDRYDGNEEQESDHTEGAVRKRPKQTAKNDLRNKLDKKKNDY
jgi:hypothetical protein